MAVVVEHDGSPATTTLTTVCGALSEHRLVIADVLCDKPPRKIPYYHLNQSTLVIKQ
jgi:hypothetical protein